MGSLVGHVAPGLGFLIIGLWHLFHNIKLHSLHPNTFRSLPWFPSPFLTRRLEPILILLGSLTSIAMELFVGPALHHPLDPSDWTIPSSHLHNFDHTAISFSILVFAAANLVFDRLRRKLPAGLPFLLASAAFGQELLMFHLHSTDHTGLEGHYHMLLQLVIAVSLVASLAGISMPASFPVAFVRSASIAFQGVWFITMGYGLWTPGLVPKGCFMHDEDGHFVVRCHDEESLHRGKSLVNILFSYFCSVMVVLCLVGYLVVAGWYCKEEAQYFELGKEDEEEEELQRRSDEESEGFVEMEKGMRSMDLVR